MLDIYDVIIIGGGPAGLTAGLYASRSKLKTLIIEKDQYGGQIATTADVENYPGSVEDVTGPELTKRMLEQAESFGTERVSDTIIEVDFKNKIKILKGLEKEYKSKTIIIATGANPRKIGCVGEDEFSGRGVSYCATCDAPFFQDLEVYVIGGGDTAVEEGLYITKFAKKVNIVHRRDELRASKTIQERAFKNDKINFIWNSTVKEIKGEGLVNSIVLENTKTGEIKEYKAIETDGTFGIFPFVGFIPTTDLFKDVIDLKDGYIWTDETMHTSIDGVYAAGDVRHKSLRQVVTATADGAIAAMEAEKYINDNF